MLLRHSRLLETALSLIVRLQAQRTPTPLILSVM
jgi:hypothetical protein